MLKSTTKSSTDAPEDPVELPPPPFAPGAGQGVTTACPCHLGVSIVMGVTPEIDGV